MIYRIAENCYWLQRYFERVNTSSQLLKVCHAGHLDHTLNCNPIRFHPLIVSAGYDEANTPLIPQTYEDTIHLLTWNCNSDDSICSNLKRTRDNAHVLREIICDESWVVINTLWLWLSQERAKGLYHANRINFFDKINEQFQLTQGIFQETVRHDEVYHFMQMGLLIEKAILNTKIIHLSLLHTNEHPQENQFVFWKMILEGLHAWEPFCSLYSTETVIHTLFEFMLLDRYFPCSIRFCMNQLETSLGFVGSSPSVSLNEIDQLLSETQGELELRRNSEKIAIYTGALVKEMENLSDKLSKEYFQVIYE